MPESPRGFESAPAGDLRIMIYTAEPRTRDSGRLALLTVLGIRTLAG